MKKSLFLLCIGLSLSFSSFAQGLWTGSTTVTTNTTGNVGIGHPGTFPNATLHVFANNMILGGSTWKEGIVIHNGTSGSYSGNLFRISEDLSLSPPSPAYDLVTFGNSKNYFKQKIQIGDLSSVGLYNDWKLSVDGNIIAKRLVIQVDYWADYVFDANYKLPSLNNVESYINENKHLPGVPSQAEIVEKGLDISQMNTILMQKVEELTLYMIQLQKDNEELQKRISMLEEK